MFTASPETLWHALTDAETLESLGISSDIAPRVGHRFQFRPASGAEGEGPIEAEMISVDAPRQFAFKWLNGPLDEPTTVTVNLDPEADGTVTRIRLSHTDPTGESCMAGAASSGRTGGNGSSRTPCHATLPKGSCSSDQGQIGTLVIASWSAAVAVATAALRLHCG